LEQLVFREIKHFFDSEERIASTLALDGDDLATIRALVEGVRRFAKNIDEVYSRAPSERLAGIVTRVIIHQDSIEIYLSKDGARARLLNPAKIAANQSQGIQALTSSRSSLHFRRG
jgi:site-specific DNA recombinase